MKSVFIVGIDTGVGKTTVAAGILKLLYGIKKVCYWKPVQTGTIVGDDTATVKGMTEFEPDVYLEPAYRFAEPVSPHVAAKKWGKKVDLGHLRQIFEERVKAGYFIVIEGAGGLLVPFNETELQIDFVSLLKIPMILVAEDRVGAINQSLLSIRAARDAGIELLGVILTRTRRTLGNSESISHFGSVEILAELDPTEDPRTVVAEVAGHRRLRGLFGVSNLPH